MAKRKLPYKKNGKKARMVTSVSFVTGVPEETRAEALYEQAKALVKEDESVKAIKLLQQALEQCPAYADALALQAKLLAQHKKYDVAVRQMQQAVLLKPEEPKWFWQLSRWAVAKKDFPVAIAAMKRCVELQPQKTEPKRQLAALYGNLGLESFSQHWARKAVRSRAFEVLEARIERRLTVISLHTSTSGALKVGGPNFTPRVSEGHNNLTGLLDPDYITLVRVHVDSYENQPELPRLLPKADIVYNSITDPERCEQALGLAQKLCDRLDLPVINEPNAVLAASREGNYARFKNTDEIIVPKSHKVTAVTGACRPYVKEAIQQYGFELPVIVRLAGFQGGKYMHLVNDPETHDFSDLDYHVKSSPQTLYLIQYHEVGFEDGRVPDHTLYPKFRAFMVNKELYQAHFLVVPDNFNVRRPESNAFFDDQPWLKEERDKFLASPEDYLPAGVWRVLEAEMRKIGLDYCGVDFAFQYDEEGSAKIVIFEANASMRNMIGDQAPGHPISRAYFSINLGVHQMFIDRAGVEPWDCERSLMRGEEARKV